MGFIMKSENIGKGRPRPDIVLPFVCIRIIRFQKFIDFPSNWPLIPIIER
jgi:hypothetical protein